MVVNVHFFFIFDLIGVSHAFYIVHTSVWM